MWNTLKQHSRTPCIDSHQDLLDQLIVALQVRFLDLSKSQSKKVQSNRLRLYKMENNIAHIPRSRPQPEDLLLLSATGPSTCPNGRKKKISSVPADAMQYQSLKGFETRCACTSILKYSSCFSSFSYNKNPLQNIHRLSNLFSAPGLDIRKNRTPLP